MLIPNYDFAIRTYEAGRHEYQDLTVASSRIASKDMVRDSESISATLSISLKISFTSSEFLNVSWSYNANCKRHALMSI